VILQRGAEVIEVYGPYVTQIAAELTHTDLLVQKSKREKVGVFRLKRLLDPDPTA
jgi:hypothetical protein